MNDYEKQALGRFIEQQPELKAIISRVADALSEFAAAVADTKAEDRQRSRDDLKRQRREMWRSSRGVRK